MANPAAPAPVAPEQLALQRLYHWEKTAPDRVILTQPLGGGAIRDFTWGEAIGEVRRMAAHLRSLGLPPGSRDRPAVEEHRPLAARRLRDLDGRPRLGAALSDARRRHDPADPRAQRVAAALRRQARRLGGDAARRAGRPAVHRPAARAAERLSDSGTTIVARHGADDGFAGARRQRARDHHVHLGHDRHAQGRDAQLRHLRLGDRRRPEAGADRQRGAACSATCRSPTSPSARWSSTRCSPPACTCSSPRAWTPSSPTCSARGRRSSSRCRACGSSSSRRRREDAAGQAAAAAAHPDRARPGGEEDAARARPRRLRLRRRRRGADAAGAAALVRPARPADLSRSTA